MASVKLTGKIVGVQEKESKTTGDPYFVYSVYLANDKGIGGLVALTSKLKRTVGTDLNDLECDYQGIFAGQASFWEPADPFQENGTAA